ncbi:MAG: N-acetyl-gamma-glutamyl-phosphate reductase [Acidimicrobiia bacterium]|nr:N-acetyl-gamma-glutamyl-phosphate reductase [Acidimicrobiia bacterium]MDH3396295.1 N-acetyl-gamma-glutamyl-phosphate reductase [Acidimicrobiia bacterium]MDH5615787.1 N-acetyl-gamma-glutamyl-phosphate reductase [Acidimicrobiia bacterium]
MGHSVAILGASGYAGGELVRLIDDHPAFDVIYLGANANAGRQLAEVHPHLTGGGRLLGSTDPADLPPVDLAFLALPHGASARVAGEILERGTRVIDLGSDYRLDTEERYESAYGTSHPFPGRLGEWAYGLPELFGGPLPGADRVAVPGCYPTATVLGLAPLLVAGLIQPEGIVVHAVSGVSGAGRSAREELQFGAIDENVGAYAVGRHRHRPEIEMALEMAAGIRRVSVTFTPHLVPMQRGILATATAVLTKPVKRAALQQILQAAYRDAKFVEVIDGSPQTRWVVGSNRALISAFTDDTTGHAIVLVAIDNLVKGAAGQAIQIANLMLGLDEDAGLPLAGWTP